MSRYLELARKHGIGLEQESNVILEPMSFDGIRQEGFLGGLSGFMVGCLLFAPTLGFSNLGIATALANRVDQKRNEIDKLKEEIVKMASEHGRNLVKEGKITEDSYKEQFKLTGNQVLRGIVYGGFLGPFYAMAKGSELENLVKKERELIKEYQKILIQVNDELSKNAKEEKSSTEEYTGDNKDDIQEHLDAIDETSDEVEETLGDVEKMDKAAATLESFAEMADEAAKTRGLARSTLIGIGVGVEHILSDFGLDSSLILPSLESYGLEEESKPATKKFADSLRDLIKSILEGIVKAARFLINKSQEIYTHISKLSPIAKARIVALKKVLAATAEADFPATIKLSAAERTKLFIGEKGYVKLEAAALAAALAFSKELPGTSDQMKNSLKAVKATVGIVAGKLPELTDVNTVLEEFSKSSDALFTGMNKNASTVGKADIPEGYDYLSTTGELPGGRIVVVAGKKDENGGIETHGLIAGVRSIRPAMSFTEDSDIVIKRSDVLALLDGLEAMISSAGNVAIARKSLSADVNSAIDSVTALSKAIESKPPTDTEAAASAKKLATVVASKMQTYNKVITNGIDAPLAYLMRNVVPTYINVIGRIKKDKSSAV